MRIKTLEQVINWLQAATFETAVRINLKLLEIYSTATGAPIAVTAEVVSVDASLFKRILWALSLGVVMLRCIFVGGTMALSYTVDRFWNPIYFPFYIGIFGGCWLASVVGYVCLTLETGNFVMTWNMLLKHKSEVKSPKLMIWMLSFFFPIGNLFPIALSIFLALNPQLVNQFRFAVTWALEEGLLAKGSTYYALAVLTTVADFWSAILVMATCLVVLPCHMLFLETWTSLMNQLIQRSIQKVPAFGVKHVCGTLGELLAGLRVFNVGNASVVFATKLFGLVLGISCQSSVIILDFSDNLLFFGIILYMSTFAPFMYPAFYHRAPAVCAGLQRAKSELLKGKMFTKVDPSFERRLWAISPKGVWVGSFRTYERESDLIYLSFIVNQVASVVLAKEA